MSDRPIQLLLIAGSAEHPSHARTNIEAVAELLQERGASVYLWDIYDDPLPIFNPIYYRDPRLNEAEVVRRLVWLADEADGFVLASPNYHNSFSGVLKNALDSLTIAQFRNKPVALMSTGNSDRTGVQPCDQLQNVVRGLHAVTIPTQLVTIIADYKLSQGRYVLVNNSLNARLVRLVDDLLTFAVLTRQLRSIVTKQ